MNFLRQLVRQLFPKPRQPLRWRDGVSLALFWVVFVGVCLFLVLSELLQFARPAALGLALFAAWIWWLQVAGYAGLGRVRGQWALWVRFVLLALFVMLLAEPRSLRSRDVVSAMFLVDVSDSVRSDAVDAAMRYVVESAANKPSQDEVGLLIFGETPAVEQPPRMNYIVEALNAQVDRGSTNIEQAVSLGAAMLSDEQQGRLILLSDGVQTSGDVLRRLDDLASRGIAIDVLPIDYSYEREVWVERIDLPQQVKIGETYEAAVVLSALTAGRGRLRLTENGESLADQEIEFQPGKNRYSVPIALRSAGYYEYAATIDVDTEFDSLTQNNTALGAIFVEGAGQILLVTDPAGDPRDWEPLAQFIRDAEREVRVIKAFEFPGDTSALMPYDCIIFCNVAYDAFDFGQLAGLRDAVYHVGTGFLMVGGKNSFGPGGWHRSVVEEILPVTMDVDNKKVLPKGALAIILHTCEFAQGNTWAKRITKQAIKVLSARDEAGVLAYTDRGEEWVFELTPAGEYEQMVPLIDGANIGDMPSFQTTMELGLAGLKASDAASKHMIIISDGDPSPPPPNLLQGYVENQISISTVAVFPHGGFEQTTMQAIAGATGGRYYFVNQNPNVLPSIFIKESKTLKRSMIQNKTFAPEMGFPSPVLKGIDAIPELQGYVVTNGKPSPAMMVLNAPPDEQDPSQSDPVLAIWQHGLGKTAAWTSDLSPNWAADWQAWDRYQAFIQQLLTELARAPREGHLQLSNYTTSQEALLVAEDFHPDETFLDVRANITGPDGKAISIPMPQVGTRRYQASVPIGGHGRYHVAVTATGADRSEQSFSGYIVSYSPEYLRFRSDRQLLSELVNRTGGRWLTGDAVADDIYHTHREVKRSTQPVFDAFLIALACLLPLDVAIRRIQIDFSALRRLFRRRKIEPTATMGSLLERKRSLQTDADPAPKRQLPPPPPRQEEPSRRPPPPPPSSPPPPQGAPPPAPTGDTPMSTMEKLLRMKKQRDEDQSESS